MNITALLSEYGCMERTQLARLYNPANPAAVRPEIGELILYRMLAVRGNLIQLCTGKWLAPDPDLIASLWVMLLLCEGHIESVEHRHAAHPFSVRFRANGKTYSILPVHDTVPANVLNRTPAGDTVLALLMSGTVPEDLNIPDGVPVVFVTYRRPDKWGKPFIRTYADRELKKEL